MPPLASVIPQSVVAFACFSRKGQILRTGELPVEQLVSVLSVHHVDAILHPDDAIVMTLSLPPLPGRRLTAAVVSSVEPLTLSDVSELCIAHGPRAVDGKVCVAWAERARITRVWHCLADAGLKVDRLVPHALALPPGDAQPAQPLALPVDERWQARLPSWSLAQPDCRPANPSHPWRAAAFWIGAAVLIWLLGLNFYAAKVRGETRAIHEAMDEAVRTAFPSIQVVIDPVRQAQNMRDQLRMNEGAATNDDFMSLLTDSAAAMEFAAGQVASLRYDAGMLTVVLVDGDAPPVNEASVKQAFAARGLELVRRDKTQNAWQVRRAGMALRSEERS
ncbi:type II secretion system protein GspL [Bordetella sp. 15P40C-2]|uniref:type II secretion system protein GspL n=1 Tax=Bordetella sp. 15P40C-2 TaxID=2572246 RepID=UPI0013213993|nr:type II secretion system protein GspL [Bordetella sp. 15P40C-2]MVW72505.1 general secretion pathway protein GspL [Bordetella sp. 15P40C-2]